MSPCTVMHLCLVVLTCNGTICLNTSSQFRVPLWLQPAAISWDIWIPFTEQLFPHYVTARSRRINIPRGSPSIFSRRYNFSHLLLPVRNYFNDMWLRHYYGEKSVSRRQISTLTRSLLSTSCLNPHCPIGRHNKTLTRVTDNHWKIPVSPFYDCTFTMTIVKTYHNFHLRTYKSQLVGAANVIEQHLTNTPCSATMETTLNMGSCILQENPKHIIVWKDPQHNRQEMNTLGVHEIKQQGTYILLRSLHVGGAIQQEFGRARGIVQLDNDLVIRHVNPSRTSFIDYLT